MKIAIIGTGYVGLPTGVCFAELGNQVVCVDSSELKIQNLNNNIIPFYEPDLQDLLKSNKELGRITFTKNLSLAIKNANIIIIAVGTPSNKETGHADLTFIKNAILEIAQNLSKEDGYKVIAIKSTVPIGTNKLLESLILQYNSNLQVDIVSIPEFLREGKAISDFLNPERIIIGIDNDRAKELIDKLYKPFTERHIPLVFCSRKSAEMIKYASNSFLGIKVSFINELADLCEALGADIRDVSKGIGLDSRIGSKFLLPGPGFGGSCFPKDMIEILTTSKENKTPLTIVEASIHSNSNRSEKILQKIEKALNNNLFNKQIAIWGLSFKAETDDVRFSPAIPIIKKLQERETSININAFDPEANQNMFQVISNINYFDDMYECAKNADVLIVMTEWPIFADVDIDKLYKTMRLKTILDLRNILNPKKVVERGFNYFPLGFYA